MADVVAAIQTAIDIVGKLRTLSKKIEDAEFKMLLADLSGELADAKLEVANLKVLLAEANESNQKLTEQLTRKKNETPTLANGAYSFASQEGFFCTACFDKNQEKIRVTPLTGAFSAIGKWRCPACKATLR